MPNLERLNSWKEIAAFFGKDVRTVRRWEATRRLPVHRVPGGGRSGVFCYTSELHLWLANVEAVEPEVELTTIELPSGDDPELQADRAPDSDGIEPAPPDLSYGSANAGPTPAPEPPRSALLRRYTLIAPVVVTLVAGTIFAIRQRHEAPAQTPDAASLKGAPSAYPGLSADAEAQELYLRGRYEWNQRTEPAISRAVDLFTQAILRDPKFAAAYAGLADSYIFLRQYGHMTDQEAFPRALVASSRALQLDQTSAEAHRTYAFLLNYWLWDFPASEREFKKAIALRSTDAQTHHWYATALYSSGRFDEGLREIDEARRLQPDSISIMANRGLLLAALNQKAALSYLLETERDSPDFAPVHRYLGERYAAVGDYKQYLVQFRRFAELRNDPEAMAIYDRGEHELEAHGSQGLLLYLGDAFGRLADDNRGDSMLPAFYFAKLGDKDRALHYMRLAGERHDADFLTMNEEPAFAPLYGTPEYRALLTLRRTPVPTTAAAQGMKLVPAR